MTVQGTTQVASIVLGGFLLSGCKTSHSDSMWRVAADGEGYCASGCEIGPKVMVEAMRVCHSRAAAVVEGLDGFEYIDVNYFPAPVPTVMMITADRSHGLGCKLGVVDGKIDVIESRWDGIVFKVGDRLKVNAGLDARKAAAAKVSH